MHNFNTPSGTKYMTENCWNSSAISSEIMQNSPMAHHDYYESKMIFGDDLSAEAESVVKNTCVDSDDLSEAISFLNSDTEILNKSAQQPVSVRVVWNLLENVSRVYLPRVATSSEQEAVCLSVKGDPYSVRENGVMLDALNYVRMLFSEQPRALPAY